MWRIIPLSRCLVKKTYTTPTLIEYGPIADHTFTTPGGRYKGCKSHCHLDKFSEPSAIQGS